MNNHPSFFFQNIIRPIPTQRSRASPPCMLVAGFGRRDCVASLPRYFTYHSFPHMSNLATSRPCPPFAVAHSTKPHTVLVPQTHITFITPSTMTVVHSLSWHHSLITKSFVHLPSRTRQPTPALIPPFFAKWKLRRTPAEKIPSRSNATAPVILSHRAFVVWPIVYYGSTTLWPIP